MLTWEDDVEVHALSKRGWSISGIARHTGRDRKTVRAYLNGTSTPGVRRRTAVNPFEVFLAYATARLVDDPHLWVRTLCDELEGLGYAMSYQTLTRQVRERKLRPICQACLTATEHPTPSSSIRQVKRRNGIGWICLTPPKRRGDEGRWRTCSWAAWPARASSAGWWHRR